MKNCFLFLLSYHILLTHYLLKKIPHGNYLNQIKALEIKTSMLINLDFANCTVLFFFLIIDLYFLISAVITQIFNSTAEVAILAGTPTKEAKAELETHPVTVETKISKCSI